jgi:hypothetical protein
MQQIRTLLPAMTLEQAKQKCPQAFATEPSNDVSSRYIFVSTENIISDMENLGWYVVSAMQRKARKGVETRFTPHMIIFQNPDIQITSEDEKLAPSIILLNSHDGTHTLQFRMGIFRAACSNGLVIPEEEFTSFKIRHRGYTFDLLKQSMETSLSLISEKVDVINKMMARTLTDQEQMDLALKALLIRTKISPESVETVTYSEETLRDVLVARRPADRWDTLWHVFNRVQEAVTHGGFPVEVSNGTRRNLPALKSFERDFDMNQKLFAKALEFVN